MRLLIALVLVGSAPGDAFAAIARAVPARLGTRPAVRLPMAPLRAPRALPLSAALAPAAARRAPEPAKPSGPAGKAKAADGALDGLSLPLPAPAPDAPSAELAASAEADFAARLGGGSIETEGAAGAVAAADAGGGGPSLSPSRARLRAARAAPPSAVARRARFYGVMRRLARPALRALYRLEVSGLEHLPPGPVLVVANHVSWLDSLVLSYAVDRPMRFMMAREYYARLRRAVEPAGAIPVRPNDRPAQVLESIAEARGSLLAGESVAIFPEGHFTYNGMLRGLYGGFARIAEGTGAPVVPAYIDGLWGSALSMRGEEPLARRLLGSAWRRLWAPGRRLSVRFGPPLKELTVEAAHAAISEAGAESLEARVRAERRPLVREFFAAAKKRWGRPAIADSTGRELSYGRALTGSVLLGGLFERELSPEERNVAVLVPPSAGGALANLALASIGRVPVNLNYTAGRDALRHAVDSAGLRTVVASKRALAALAKRGFELPQGLRVLLLEDLSPRLPAWRRTLAYLALRALPARLAERLFIPRASRSLDDTATILFTSGSSALPKGVPLSQLNVLSNVEMLGEVLPPLERKGVLGVLPFFHSFGFTVTLWMPLIRGMSAAYHTHPLETDAIAKLAARTRPAFLLGTPAFLERYAQRVPPKAFSSLEMVVAGAEKLRDSVAEAFEAKFGVRPLEGYGATELSPVATLSIPDATLPGVDGLPRLARGGKGFRPGSVGRALPGSAARVVDVETGALLPAGRVGMLQIKGPHRMSGYLGDPAKTAEAIRDGWYVTGDLARVDEDGFIYLEGRLSRFSKIAGEMVSHVAVEDALQRAAGAVGRVFAVTGVAGERGERVVVLYSGWDGDIDALRAAAREQGLANIALPAKADFHRVDAIPLLGTGKLDLKALNDLAALANP